MGEPIAFLPMPADAPDGENIAVFTPMRRPFESRSGPPELPGFCAIISLEQRGEYPVISDAEGIVF